ncbi:NicO-domain-containing protein [Lentinus tigrinus ALCF2SS1-7]|uniref:Nickel/cobalt efflux system n=1 Tax=Lentinus tigrinus ALCF2SS1-6 TaxID=1328759 RepID=A0A5C2SG89_9APHY|nr:NicO-domain-containing protein [Lentinus tigrinus ALCF2SS1-6]RPD78008.1 NicO-domain-containing protein [Lentinus tigrinus ALCF2SS1-7]
MARRLSGLLSFRRPRLPGSRPRLTLFGRSLLLLTAELLANAVCWIVCAILFGRRPATRSILSLALLAWTIGLRHALDADHISAIDNATRSLINLGQLPVTCGLFFSLGHSTIVIVVNVAIAISTDVYDHIDGVGEVGSIVGAAVSASFLFIVGLANSIILYRILRKRYRLKKERALRAARGEEASHSKNDVDEVDEHDEHHGNTLMMRLIGPIVTFVDRPWKMYPVGVLFGFGFDTASSIALLAISAIAKRDPDGQQINPGDIVILPLLFTVGMTLIDSLDSIIMLYSYAGFPERSFAIFERRPPPTSRLNLAEGDAALPQSAEPAQDIAKRSEEAVPVAEVPRTLTPTTPAHPDERHEKEKEKAADVVTVEDPDGKEESELARRRTLRVKHNAMSNLSILLTIMSIMVAFSISLITTMGLIGDHCTPCQNAANADDGGGLAGRWWRGWANANDNSGYIGAAIVGSFIFVVGSWYGARYLYRKWQRRQGKTQAAASQ